MRRRESLLGDIAGKSPSELLLLVDSLMGSLQHPGHQDYEFLKGDLSIFISIQLLEYFVNGRLVFGVLGEGKAGTVSSPLSRPRIPQNSA